MALVELLKGDLKNGFMHYPARFKAITSKKRPDFPQPLWRGEDLRDKAILITVDQGHGDTLMMARYLPLLREKGARVLLQAQPALVPLLQKPRISPIKFSMLPKMRCPISIIMSGNSIYRACSAPRWKVLRRQFLICRCCRLMDFSAIALAG